MAKYHNPDYTPFYPGCSCGRKGQQGRLLSSPARWERQERWTQCSVPTGRLIVVLRFSMAMVGRLGRLVWLAGVELVLARLVALGSFRQ